jgi:hypothetical protein
MLQLILPAGKHLTAKGCLLIVSTLIAVFFPVQAFCQADDPQSNATDRSVIVGEIILTGNKITRPDIIYREILFSTGDVIPLIRWNEVLDGSRQNLLNTSLFNFVEIETEVRKENPSIIDVTFRFVERWYIWPIPLVELADRNFNEWWETRDFSRLNYGLYMNHNNFRGRRELLQALFLTGYSQAFAISYLKPNMNRAQTIGIGLNASYNRRRELAYATQSDQLVYFHHPGEYSMTSFMINALFYYRPKIHESHSFWLQFSDYRFSDTIQKLNPVFLHSGNNSPRFLSMVYEFRSDHRNLKYYPTSGYYYDLVVSKHGLGFSQNNGVNILNVSTTYKKYTELLPRWFLLSGATLKISSSSRPPYFMTRSLGYMYDFVRGYEYYVVDGQHLGLLKTNIKYQVLQPTIIKLPFIKTEKFSKLHLSLYLGLHFDIGYVLEPNNHKTNGNQLPNRLLWGNGIGFDVVTYYDRVMRMEYSINHLGEHGFFLHFLAPI